MSLCEIQVVCVFLTYNELSNFLLTSQVVYFGDSMHSDIFPAHHYSNWETVFILEELLGDQGTVPAKAESEPLEKKGKYEVRVPADVSWNRIK